MIPWISAGLIMGALGSLHCIGMCGPLAMTLPEVNSSSLSRFTGTLLYNLGRVTTYAILGMLLGAIGYSFVLLGFQKWLTISAGAGMLIYLLLSGKIKSNPGASKVFSPLRKAIGKLYTRPGYSSLFTIGLLNGLLPCGLVYTALAVAVVGGNVKVSGVYMASFGAGTLPMMWMIAFFAGSIRSNFRISIRTAYPYIIFLMACILILRGLNLGIPFLSPAFENGHTHAPGIECHD